MNIVHDRREDAGLDRVRVHACEIVGDLIRAIEGQWNSVFESDLWISDDRIEVYMSTRSTIRADSLNVEGVMHIKTDAEGPLSYLEHFEILTSLNRPYKT